MTPKFHFGCLSLLAAAFMQAQTIPLPEHPRPDFERPLWANLNGDWRFAFDPSDTGLRDAWADKPAVFDRTIHVPFPWGSELSGLEDGADIGWYRREVRVDPAWEGRRVFLVIGASDWETSVWLDGQLLGTHQGGYLPIEMELTPHVKFGQVQQLVVRADDVRRDFTLYGKQGYGNARGIWQTVYLEARGSTYLEALHFTPDIDRNEVVATAFLPAPPATGQTVQIRITGEAAPPIVSDLSIPAGSTSASVRIPIAQAHLWSLEDPFLYQAEATLGNDAVHSYFGMRKISVVNLPGTDFPYIALNDKPVYLKLALDQSYHPEGFYTFPSDRFMQQEIMRSKSIGLNGIRTHVKVEIPRKLYWADKLGLLVMADLPNSWGEPGVEMQRESEAAFRGMVRRDYNHPSIFSWILFNETWGLTRKGVYGADTQQWVVEMYHMAKSLDASRLVEDNSICCGFGHTETDINSWHIYLPGYKWEEHLKELTENTYEGSPFNFEKGYKQGRQPLINSECGNVWGYEGSTGDVDWSWDYHMMMNTFRRYPRVGGWLYTEHHDVVNEWNGYWRFDRSEKETGLEQLVPGMTLNDLHAGVYLSPGMEICLDVTAGQRVEIPLFLSDMDGIDRNGQLTVAYSLEVTNDLGESLKAGDGELEVAHTPYMQKALPPLSLQVPEMGGIGILRLTLSAGPGEVLSRNFLFLNISGKTATQPANRVTVAPDAYTASEWTAKSWSVLDGKKMNGAGKGFFEYTFMLPENFELEKDTEVFFLAELSAKELLVKDAMEYDPEQDFMKGSKVANSSNPNSYPMTNWLKFPSRIRISVNGFSTQAETLPDDPADHRGVLSWHAQPRDGKLREAGSYGYLVKVPVYRSILENALAGDRKILVRLETEGQGGIAVYGRDFGRYPLDPGLVITQ